MALFDPAARSTIQAAHVKAIYGLLKGRAGDEDTILIKNNVARAQVNQYSRINSSSSISSRISRWKRSPPSPARNSPP